MIHREPLEIHRGREQWSTADGLALVHSAASLITGGASAMAGFVAGFVVSTAVATAASSLSWWPAPLLLNDLVVGAPTPPHTPSSFTTSTDPRWIDDVTVAPVAVIGRADWDAAPVPLARLRPRSRPLSSASFLVVHHSDFSAAPGPQAILDYHRGPAGFADIGYHFVVASDGTVFEARPIDRVGAHAGISVEQRRHRRHDPDEDAIGIVLDGSFEHERPPPAQVAAMTRLLRDLRARYQIPARRIIGHRDVKARIVEAHGLTFAGSTTVCPGDAAFDVIAALRLLSEPPRGRRSGLVGVRVASTSTP